MEKKLVLSKETLRSLDDAELADVAGGATGICIGKSVACDSVVCKSAVCNSAVVCQSGICGSGVLC
jgi:hypothetical protein